MEDVNTLGRITSGVKLINLDEDIKVVKIAKVREKVSDGSKEYDEVEDAMEDIPESEAGGMIDDDEEVTLPVDDSEDE